MLAAKDAKIKDSVRLFIHRPQSLVEEPHESTIIISCICHENLSRVSWKGRKKIKRPNSSVKGIGENFSDKVALESSVGRSVGEQMWQWEDQSLYSEEAA